VCVGKLLEHLDKWLVLDDILPMLPEIPSREPAVLMGILGIYKVALTHKKLGITKDVMATKVIPFLMPLSIENGLNLSQFNAVIAVVKDMVNRVEADHRAKLEQLNSMQQEQRSSLDMSKVHMPNKNELITGIETKPLSDTDQMFQGLGLGKYVQERDVTKTAAEFLPATANGSTKPTTAPGSSKPTKASLSMEDKERLAREQDRHQQLKQQVPLKPNPNLSKRSQPAKTKDGPRNLTDSLISSNLANMSVGQPRPAYTPNYDINISSFSSGQNMAAGGSVYPMGPQTAFQTSPQAGFYTNGMAPSNTGWMLSNSTNSPVAPASIPNQQIQPNFASFDNLLTTASSKPKMSMNQMATTPRPAVFPFQSSLVQNTMVPQRFQAPGLISPPPNSTGLSSPPSSDKASNASVDLSDWLG